VNDGLPVVIGLILDVNSEVCARIDILGLGALERDDLSSRPG
jgi:hypothetical protein